MGRGKTDGGGLFSNQYKWCYQLNAMKYLHSGRVIHSIPPKLIPEPQFYFKLSTVKFDKMKSSRYGRLHSQLMLSANNYMAFHRSIDYMVSLNYPCQSNGRLLAHPIDIFHKVPHWLFVTLGGNLGWSGFSILSPSAIVSSHLVEQKNIELWVKFTLDNIPMTRSSMQKNRIVISAECTFEPIA